MQKQLVPKCNLTTFSSDNFLVIVSISHLIVEEFGPTLLYGIASGCWGFIYAQLSEGTSIQHINQVEVWTLTKPLQHIDSPLSLSFFL